MAELRITWADGRQEIRSLLPAQTITIGDSREPVLYEHMPIGGTLQLGRIRRPFCQIRLHGSEIPSIVMLTKNSGGLALPSARAARKRK